MNIESNTIHFMATNYFENNVFMKTGFAIKIQNV